MSPLYIFELDSPLAAAGSPARRAEKQELGSSQSAGGPVGYWLQGRKGGRGPCMLAELELTGAGWPRDRAGAQTAARAHG